MKQAGYERKVSLNDSLSYDGKEASFEESYNGGSKEL